MQLPEGTAIHAAIVHSVIDALERQASCRASVVSAATAAENVAPFRDPLDCVSVIRLVGTRLRGHLALCLPKATLLRLTAKLTGELHDDVSAENACTGGELLNIIYASARVKINGTGFDFEPAIPVTTSGRKPALPFPSGALWIQFTTDFGPLLVAISLERQAA